MSDKSPDLAALTEAALDHVPFDGWSEATLKAAGADLGLDRATIRSLAPRGAVDLAKAFHKQGDAAVSAGGHDDRLEGLRYSEKVAALVRFRIEHAAAHREAVRRGVTLFALPGHAPEGARLIWSTADAIWTALGDTSDDFNWYSKRAILSGVYSSTVLYWLGDESDGYEATWAFLDRRIGNVMQFEKTKAMLKKNPFTAPFFGSKANPFSRIRKPGAVETGLPVGLPGGRR